MTGYAFAAVTPSPESKSVIEAMYRLMSEVGPWESLGRIAVGIIDQQHRIDQMGPPKSLWRLCK